MANRHDAFVLDAFAVLNAGDRPIAGALARRVQVRAMGKRPVVLTNAVSCLRAVAFRKYRHSGLDFTADDAVSSRDVAAARLTGIAAGATWAAPAASGDTHSDIPARVIDLPPPGAYQAANGFLLLSEARWTPRMQHDLADHLGIAPHWFGKPFGWAFDDARDRARPDRDGGRHAAHGCSGGQGGRVGGDSGNGPCAFCGTGRVPQHARSGGGPM